MPLTNANVLSEISVTDGKVFFSINVDAAEARAWESVRAQAEAAVRAIPGVTAAMIALTAERKPGSPAPDHYQPSLPKSELDQLYAFFSKQKVISAPGGGSSRYMDITPYPGLPSPVVVTYGASSSS